MVEFTVKISDHAAALLRDMLEQDAPGLPEERTLEALARGLLEQWADGYRRPGSWERQCLVQFGHVSR